MFARVAGQACFIDLRRREFLKLSDLRYVAASIYVRFAGTVAALAADTLAAVFKGEA